MLINFNGHPGVCVGVVVDAAPDQEENNGSKNDSSTLVSKLISEHTKGTSDQV